MASRTLEDCPTSAEPFVPTPEWLRNNLPVPLSGRWEGEMTAPTGGRDLLDLRIDIDLRHDSSPILNRVSGDFYQVNRLNLPGQPPRIWKVYRESWIVDLPEVRWAQTSVEITGTVQFWKSIHPPHRLLHPHRLGHLAGSGARRGELQPPGRRAHGL